MSDGRVVLNRFKGLDLRHPRDDLEDGYLPVATNVLIDKGSLRVRGGRSVFHSTAIGSSGGVTGLHPFYRDGSTTQLLAVRNGKLYKADEGGAFAEVQLSGVSLSLTYADASFAQLDEVVICSDGRQGPYKWNGTTLTAITVPTKPTVQANVKPTRILVENCNNTTHWTGSDYANSPINIDTTIKWFGAAAIKGTVASGSSINDRFVYYYKRDNTANLDLSGVRHVGFWIRSTLAGSYLRFGWTEDGGDDPGDPTKEWQQTFDIDIIKANTWQFVSIPIMDIADDDKDAIAYLGFEVTNDDSAATVYIDQIQYSGGLNGEYEYRYSYYDSANDLESEPSDVDPGSTLGVGEGGLDLRRESAVVSGWPSGGDAAADQVRIYRRGGVSAVWRLVATIADTSTSYTDVKAEHLLGAEQDPNWGAPEAARYITTWRGRMCYARNATYPSRVWISNLEEPHKVPNITYLDANENAGAYIDVNKNDGEAITGLVGLEDRLLIFKENSIWQAMMTSFRDFTYREVSRTVGCASHKSIARWQNGVVWYTGRYIMQLTGDGLNIISDPISDRLDAIDDRDDCCGLVFDQRYYFFYEKDGSGYNDAALVYDLREQGWTEITGWNMAVVTRFKNSSDADLMYAGDSNAGHVWSLESGNNDSDGAISWEIRTPDLVFGDTLADKALRRYLIVARNVSTTSEWALAKVQSDQGRQEWQEVHRMRNVDVGESAADQVIFEGKPPSRVQGRSLSLDLSGSALNDVRVERIELEPRTLRRR